ncbi:MAG: hypothetical protein IKI85_07755 [Bacteroidales bacterium]|nr:hypothetical protein [Bacteroidales bacterium]
MQFKHMLMAVAAVAAIACQKNSPEETVEAQEASYIGTVTVNSTSGDVFDNENIEVSFTPSVDGKTATLVMYQIKFTPRMPMTLDVTIPDVNISAEGEEIKLACAEVVPLAMGGPFPNYTVTDLTGKISGDELTFSLNFGATPTSFSGSIKK